MSILSILSKLFPRYFSSWKFKAGVQNAIALLPSSVSYSVYYWIQRHFGGLRQMNPVSRLASGIETWKLIKELGHDPVGKVFFEVGTGRVPLAPVAYWLMGAEKTITIDLNPYLKSELIKESLQYISDNTEAISRLFGPLIQRDRLDKLLQFNAIAPFSTPAFLDLCGIVYVAPGDASKTNLPSQSIDFHTSYTVFEHIPVDVLKAILDEGNRIMKDGGLFVHRIDYSDHFSQSDKTISAINFLHYSDQEWSRYAGNRYMYMNRLRHDDYIQLFQTAGHRIVAEKLDVDQRSKELLRSGALQLDERFRGKSVDLLAIKGAWIATQIGRI